MVLWSMRYLQDAAMDMNRLGGAGGELGQLVGRRIGSVQWKLKA